MKQILNADLIATLRSFQDIGLNTSTHILIATELHRIGLSIASELAVVCESSTAAITGALDHLELKLGIVERTNSTTDRRKILLRLTPKGQEILDKILLDAPETRTQALAS